MKKRLAYFALVLIITLTFSLLTAGPAMAWIVYGSDVDISAGAVSDGQVQLTITETNTGNTDIWNASVTLKANGVTIYTLTKGSLGWQGGDIYQPWEVSKLNAAPNAETWTWILTVPVSITTTFEAIGYGEAWSSGGTIYVTPPNYPDELASVTVDVLPPSILLTKIADAVSVAPGVSVTYSYTVKNTGGVTLTNVTIKDDNGTPSYPADDFVVGVVPSLAPGEELTFQATKIPPVCLCVSVDSTSMENLLIIETIPDQNSDGIEDIRVTYRQSRDLVDNVYGTPANDPASGWYPKHHNFSDFTGSDEANFRFTDALGNVVLDFKADYISASKAYPSGYGTLGVTGGDGGMILGSAANVLSVSTTITTDLNQSPAFYGYTVDSPTPESNFPTWDYVDGYTVVVSGALFASTGFGSATVYSVHNSPPKIGTNAALPKPCDWDVTNTAYVTAKAGDTTLTATASTTVTVIGGTISPPGPFTTYKQDQWGGDPNKAPGAKLLNQNFSTVYPTGVSVGGINKLSFTSAAAVLAFLPQGGGPNVLKASATNPTKSDAGEFAGQVLALQLNVDFSNAGVTRSGLAMLHLKTGKLKGKTVAEVLNLANQVLGKSLALPAGISMKDLNDIVKAINQDYENGTHDRGYLQ